MSYREVRFRVKPAVIAALETGLAQEVTDRAAAVSAEAVARDAADAAEAAARVSADAAHDATLVNKLDAAVYDAGIAAETAARTDADAAHHQALLVLCGVDGALDVAQLPGSALTYVYDGSVKTLAME